MRGFESPSLRHFVFKNATNRNIDDRTIGLESRRKTGALSEDPFEFLSRARLVEPFLADTERAPSRRVLRVTSIDLVLGRFYN